MRLIPRTRRKAILYGMLISFSLLVTAVGTILMAAHTKVSDTLASVSSATYSPQQEAALDKLDPARLQRPLFLLMYGLDSREFDNDRGNPDSLMLAMIDPRAPRATLVSLPRDAYVNIPDFGPEKLNFTVPYGGPELLIETVKQWLDIPIDGYIFVNFAGFIQAVDLFGGVEVFVERPMHYDDYADGTSIHLDPGFQKLNGKKALDFVRFRMSNDGDAASDYNRMERQHQLLKALADHLISFKSASKVFPLLDIIGSNVKTSLTVKRLESLLALAPSFKPYMIDTTSLQGEASFEDDYWFEFIPQEELERIRELAKPYLEARQR